MDLFSELAGFEQRASDQLRVLAPISTTRPAGAAAPVPWREVGTQVIY
jgi:hypothetical protein